VIVVCALVLSHHLYLFIFLKLLAYLFFLLKAIVVI